LADNKKKEGCKSKPSKNLSWKTIATMIMIFGMIGSVAVMAQEGQIIKEIQIKNKIHDKEVLYKFPEPILLYPGNTIKLHCVVIPTLNYDIKRGYLNITRKDGGISPKPFPLKVISNRTINNNVTWILSDEDKEGVYIASIDIVTTDINFPDAGAYVSLNVVPAGTPIIIKFEDLNGDGKFDEGTEKSLRGWEFRVVDPNGKATTVETGNNGTINIDPAAVGDKYSITEDPLRKASKGWESAPPKELNNGVYTVEKGEKKLYFANRLKPASLVIQKFEDRNENGYYDEGEGLPNRAFQVTSIDGPDFSQKVTTNSTGIAVVTDIPFQSVTGLPNDNPMQRYSITEAPRAGWVPVQSMVKELYPGDITTMPIENVILGGRIIIHKYEDINGNNKYDREEGCSNWAITLTGPGANLRASTNESGFAVFDIGFKSDPARPGELPRNTYIIHEEPRDGWIRVKDQNVLLGPNEEKVLDILNVPESGLIVVRKYEDKNDNKNADAGEERAGWTFSLQGPGVRNPTATTNESGMASFVVDFTSDPGNPCQPPARKFIIHEVPKDGYELQRDQEVELAPGDVSQSRFLNRIPPVNLAIQKFYDANKNGIRDQGEDDGKRYPLEGWEYSVTYQDATKTYVTDVDGRISVILPGVLPEAVCTITEKLSDKPGWICTTSNPRQVRISSKAPTQLVEFGNRVNSLIFKKFNDTNLNRKQDGAEEGLPGWSFNIEGPDGRTIPTDATNIEGITTAKGLMPGRYIVREVLQNGWINTTLLAVSVDIKAGEDVVVPPFGNVKSSRVEIFKFNDTNRNGIYDSGESGLPGWIFTVKCPNGSVFTARTTNGDGITALERLTPGAYIVTETTVEGWLSTTPTIRIVNLSIGVSNMQSFGNYYCLRCHRINDEPKNPISTDSEITVIKDVSNISAEKIDRDNGYVIDYNITLCPSRTLGDIADIPTDIVIAVDNSPSINNLSESAIEGVQKLAGDIAANDKKHVTRIGLVSWSDEKNSRIEVPLIDNYTEVAARGAKIKFAEGEYTNYSTGLDTALKAFDDAGIVGGKEKKIVFITDASDSGYIKPANIADARLSGYTIFAIVVGDMKDTKASRMLNNLAKNQNGYVIQLKDLSALGEALVKTATAGSKMKNVHLVEVLPNYLALLNSTTTDDQGKVRLNGDSKDWTTTTITWDIGDLSGCWSTDFQAVFCWKLPADVNQPKLASYVNYTDEKGMSRTLTLPEHEINIVPTLGQTSLPVPAKPVEKETPGFEALFAAIGISLAGYLYRRMVH